MSNKTKPTMTKVAAKIIEIKAKLDAVKAEHKVIEDKLEKDLNTLKEYFAERAHEEGITTLKLETGGSVTMSNRTVLKCDNLYELHQFAESNDQPELIDYKLSSTAAKDYMAKHGELPPGVYAVEIPSIAVRTPK